MSTVTTKAASWMSPPSSSPSSHRLSTSHHLPPRTTSGVDEQMPPHSPKIKRASSPSYFGFTVGDGLNPPEPRPGPHAPHNWDYASSNARDTPSAVPVDPNPEFEAFRRRSEHGRFNLRHGEPVAFGEREAVREPSTNGPPAPPLQETDKSPRPGAQLIVAPKRANQPVMDMSSGKPARMPLFDIPRRESPDSLSPGRDPALGYRVARLSLPGHGLCTPPQDAERKPVQRAETLPDKLHKDGPNMFSPGEFVNLIQSLHEDVLLLDLRVAPQYSISKIRGALNLCIPTTLTKRPSFDTQKLRDTFAVESDRERFSRWRESSFIAVYDTNSNNMRDAQNAVNVLKKFFVEGWNGKGIILKGGFAELSKSYPYMIEDGSASAATHTSKAPFSLPAPAQVVAPVAGGCPMPTLKTAVNPFFNNIRQNMDLVDGVGQMSVACPREMSVNSENALPEWLRKAVEKKDKGKLVSDEFLAIERTEQKRMQDALNCAISYGSPHPERPDRVQIAGVEKGAKNRYNNIFPYDHSRVHLQGFAAGSCDYINANYIKASYSNKRYIATQAPIPATFNDFWQLVWEQDTRVIVMLTAESEGGQLKSHSYWHTGDYGALRLKLLSERRIPLEVNRTKTQKLTLKRSSYGQCRSPNSHTEAARTNSGESKQDPPEAPFAIVRHFTLSHSNLPFQPMREVTQLQYTHWPDFGAPAHPQHLLALIEQTGKYVRGSASPNHRALNAADPAPRDQRPILVHCSAGCGRTGTFCTVDSVIDMLKRQRAESGHDRMDIDSDDDVHAGEWVGRGDVDLIAKTVEDFRGQRLSMVQSLRQFVLCYETVLDWLVEQQMLDGKD